LGTAAEATTTTSRSAASRTAARSAGTFSVATSPTAITRDPPLTAATMPRAMELAYAAWSVILVGSSVTRTGNTCAPGAMPANGFLSCSLGRPAIRPAMNVPRP
jgi:hypothetical protein